MNVNWKLLTAGLHSDGCDWLVPVIYFSLLCVLYRVYPLLYDHKKMLFKKYVHDLLSIYFHIRVSTIKHQYLSCTGYQPLTMADEERYCNISRWHQEINVHFIFNPIKVCVSEPHFYMGTTEKIPEIQVITKNSKPWANKIGVFT